MVFPLRFIRQRGERSEVNQRTWDMRMSFLTTQASQRLENFALARRPRAFTLSGMHRKLMFPLIAVTLLGSVACGGDDEGSTGVKSGLDESKPLNTLTSAEVEQLGKALAREMEESGFQEGICVLTGLLAEAVLRQAGVDGPSCEESAKTCLDDTKETEPPNPDLFADCTATVGQYQACANAMSGVLKELFSGLTCDTNPQDAPQIDASSFQVEECEVIKTKCPTLNAAITLN
jgi:hypothetical protein